MMPQVWREVGPHLPGWHLVRLQLGVACLGAPSPTPYELEANAITHLVGDGVTGVGCSTAALAPGAADLVVSRICVLHIPLADRAELFNRVGSWLRPGGVLAMEDYAAADTGLSATARETLEEAVSVPAGELPTFAEWKATLTTADSRAVSSRT